MFSKIYIVYFIIIFAKILVFSNIGLSTVVKSCNRSIINIKTQNDTDIFIKFQPTIDVDKTCHHGGYYIETISNKTLSVNISIESQSFFIY